MNTDMIVGADQFCFLNWLAFLMKFLVNVIC